VQRGSDARLAAVDAVAAGGARDFAHIAVLNKNGFVRVEEP
jgi:hypothetical protein